MFNVNTKKLERQQQSLEKWKNNNANGIIIYPPGTGKTYVSILAIQKLNINKPDYIIHVVVPTSKLKEDWVGNKTTKGHIEIHGLKNVEVFIINSYIKTPRKCDFLVIDEIHRVSATTFITALDTTIRKFFMGLTGTLERLDGKQHLLLKHTKVVDRMTEEEAKRDGFISDFLIFNLGIDLTDDEKLIYEGFNSQFYKKFNYFGMDFNLAMLSAKGLNPQWNGSEWRHSDAAMYAIRKGYQAEPLDIIINRYLENKKRKLHNKTVTKRADKKKLIKLYQADFNHIYNPNVVHIQGLQFINYMKLRKEFGFKLESKLNSLLEIHNAFPTKQMICFSEDTLTADNAVLKLSSDVCRAYHTKLTKKEKSTNVKMFEDGKLKVLSTVKALNEGFNVEGIEITCRLAHTKSKIQVNQSIGRGNRIDVNNPDKCAIHINVYLNDFIGMDGKKVNSHEKKTILENQKGKNVIWVDSVQEIVDIMNERNIISENDIILN